MKKDMTIDIVLHSPYVSMERNGDLIDLNFCGLEKLFRGNSTVLDDGTLVYRRNDIFRVSLGFSMKLPEGKTARVFPRSGTRKNFNVLLTNSVGCIDEGYNGTDDIWLAEFLAIDDGEMKLGDRILQFEIIDKMPKVEFNVVESLEAVNRGGFSSTGV